MTDREEHALRQKLVAVVRETGAIMHHEVFDADGGCAWRCHRCSEICYPNRPCGCGDRTPAPQ